MSSAGRSQPNPSACLRIFATRVKDGFRERQAAAMHASRAAYGPVAWRLAHHCRGPALRRRPLRRSGGGTGLAGSGDRTAASRPGPAATETTAPPAPRLDQAADRLPGPSTWGCPAKLQGRLAAGGPALALHWLEPAVAPYPGAVVQSFLGPAGCWPWRVPRPAVFANGARPQAAGLPCSGLALARGSRWWSWPDRATADRTRRPPALSARLERP